MTKHPWIYRLLHWSIALLMIGALITQMVFNDMPLSPEKFQWISYHKWIGFTVLLFFIPRLFVRKMFTSDAVVKATWEHWIMKITHFVLYASMVMLPLTGWLMTSAKGFPLVYLGLIPIPDLIGPNADLGHFFKELHEACAAVFITSLVLHLGGVVKHYVIYKHKLLRKMI